MNSRLCRLQNVRLGAVARPRLQVDDLQIPAGTTAILGKSGAGKTSLLNLLAGFETPDHGSVVVDPPPASNGPPLSWVPSDFGLWPHLSVQQHLTAVAAEQNAEQIEQLLEQFDLDHISHQRPESLSMGERARLAVARSLATGAAIHLLDEPFAHVDPGRIDGYWGAVREHLTATAASLIFASHSPVVVMREANQVFCLEHGHVSWTGTPTELYSAPPTAGLAALLGPANWISTEEKPIWFSRSIPAEDCFRPDHLELEAVEDSALVVERSWFVGPHQETDVRNTSNNLARRLYHRAQPHNLAAGTKVVLRVLLSCVLLMVLIGQQGCRESAGNDPILHVAPPHQYLLPSEGAMLPAARGMTYSPASELLILDNVGRVLKYNADGTLEKKWWMPAYEIGRPEGICVLQNGEIAVADTHYHRVVIFSAEGQVVRMFGEKGDGPNQFIYTSAIAQDKQGFLYVAEYGGNDRVQKFTASGEHVLTFGSVGTDDGQFQRPSGLVCHDGLIYVADAINNRIQVFNSSGKFLRVVADAHSAGLYYPYDISLGPDNSLFVVEYGAGRISRVSIEGQLLGRYGQEGRGEGEFWTPWGIAVSRHGRIAVADTGNRRVIELQL